MTFISTNTPQPHLGIPANVPFPIVIYGLPLVVLMIRAPARIGGGPLMRPTNASCIPRPSTRIRGLGKDRVFHSSF